MFMSSQKKDRILSYSGLIALSIGLVFLYSRCSGADPKTEEIVEVDALSEEEENELFEKSQLFFQASMFSIPKEDIPEEKIALGKKLYFDERLSLDGNVSCNSCHNMKAYGVDNLALSPGDTDELGSRNSPTVFYAYLHGMQFWDGRAKDVEEQAGGPILNPVEHNIPSEEFLEERLRGIEEYQTLFAQVYPEDEEAITFENITNAIGAFERQLAPPSRFDEWLEGDKTAMTTEEKKGLRAFFDNGCTTCHNGPVLGGGMLQKFGLYGDYWQYTLSERVDKGRYEETGDERDMYMFKVPSLRNVEMTYPYFHDGSVATLEEAVRIMGELQVINDISDEDVKSITTFLKALTADVDEQWKEP